MEYNLGDKIRFTCAIIGDVAGSSVRTQRIGRVLNNASHYQAEIFPRLLHSLLYNEVGGVLQLVLLLVPVVQLRLE